MKQLLPFSVLILFILSPFLSVSQAYKVDERRIYNWDGLPDWNLQYIEQYTFDNGGNKETKIEGYFMPGMILSYRHIKTYNSNNDIVLDVRQDWNNVSMMWEDDSQDVYTYYAGTDLIKDITTYDFDSEQDVFKILYEYSGDDIKKITFQDGSSGTLVNYRKYDYTYNVPGQPATEIESDWSGSTWQQTEIGTATYTPGLRELEIEKLNGGNWELYEKYLTYFSGTLETEHIQQTRVGANWVNADREVSLYDGNDNRTEYIWYSWISENWSPYYKEEQSFSMAAPLSTASFENESFKIFPNPASDILNISASTNIEKVELFDSVGKKVLSTSNIEPINVEHLKSGIYILKAYSNNRSATKNIVIK